MHSFCKGPIIAQACQPYYVKNEWSWENNLVRDELRRTKRIQYRTNYQVKLLCYETLGSLSEMFSLLRMFDLGECLCSERNSISTVGAGEPPPCYRDLTLPDAGSESRGTEIPGTHLQSPGSKSWSQASTVMPPPICPGELEVIYASQQTNSHRHPYSEQEVSLKVRDWIQPSNTLSSLGHEEATTPGSAARADQVMG